MYTCQEVGAKLGVTAGRVRQWVVDGSIQATKRGNLLFIASNEVEKMKHRRKTRGRPKKAGK